MGAAYGARGGGYRFVRRSLALPGLLALPASVDNLEWPLRWQI